MLDYFIELWKDYKEISDRDRGLTEITLRVMYVKSVETYNRGNVGVIN